MPLRNLEQPGPPTARLPEALAEPAHVAPGGLELLLAHHFPCADAGQDKAALRGPEHVLGSRREVLVDVLLARNRRDSGRGDRGVPSGALVRRAERGVRSRQNLGLGVRFLGRPAPGARGTQGGEQPSCMASSSASMDRISCRISTRLLSGTTSAMVIFSAVSVFGGALPRIVPSTRLRSACARVPPGPAAPRLPPSNHVPREFNQWADELTHPDFSGFDPLQRVPKQELCEEFVFLPRLLNGDAFDLSVGPPMLP